MMTHSEAIQEARRRKDAGEFYRKIVARYPDDLHYDRFDLACGHNLLVMPALVGPGEEVLSCRECSDDWIKAHSQDRIVTIDERIENRRLDGERSQ
jgi:hypothetical protein